MENKPGTLRSLTFQSIILTVVVFVAASAVALLAFQGIVDTIVVELGNRFAEKQVLFDRARSLQPLLRETALAKMLARSPAIRAWARDEKDAQLRSNGIGELESFRAMFRDKSYFFVIDRSQHYYFNDKEGTYSGNEYRYTLNPDDPKDGWYDATLSMDRECQLNVDRDRELDVTKVWINCVVKEGPEVLGIVGTGIDLTEFIREVVDSGQVGVNTVFIDQSGAIQAHRNPRLIDFRSLTKKMHDRKTIFRLIGSPDEQLTFRHLLDELQKTSGEVKTAFVHIDGVRYLAGAAFLEEMGWFNVTLMDLEAMVGRSHFTYFAGLMIGVLFVTMLLVTALLNHFVLNRIYRLERSVRRVSEGDYGVFSPDGRQDEIGRLSESFQEMAETIADYTTNLEAQIAKRTEELDIARKKAEQATRLKDDFVSLVSHDLRGPLGGMIGLLQILHAKKRGNAYTGEDIEILKRMTETANRLLEMTGTLLDISKLQTGQIEVKIYPFKAGQLIDRSIEFFAHGAQAKGIAVSNEIPDTKMIDVDPLLFEQVIQNLLSNAIKFCNGGDSVTLFVPDGRPNTIAVKDTGVGIDKEVLPNLFSHEVKTTTHGTAGELGTGFGLRYCKTIMEAHGGSISVESEQGVGTTFYLTLPERAE